MTSSTFEMWKGMPWVLDVVRDALLLTPAGLPTRLFLDLRERLQAESRTALGRAGWGLAYWFAELEDRPGAHPTGARVLTRT
jgi:hypothetical protein